MVVLVALGKAHAVSRLAGGDDHLADAELHRRFDDVVGAHDVDPIGLVVGMHQDAGHSGEMDDRIDGRGRAAPLEAGEVEMRGHRIEDLTGVGDVAEEVGDAGVLGRIEVEVEDIVTAVGEPRENVTARFA